MLAKLIVRWVLSFPTPQSAGWGGWICTNTATALVAADLQSKTEISIGSFESFGGPYGIRTRGLLRDRETC